MKVNVIFFLLLKEKDAHLEFLMKLISFFSAAINGPNPLGKIKKMMLWSFWPRVFINKL